MENIRQKIVEIITHTHKTPFEQADEILLLFGASKRHLLKSILEDMDGKHSDYHREVVEGYLDDGC